MVIEGGDDMEKSILKFETMTDTDLQESYSISLNLIHTIKIQSFYSAEERMTG